MPMAALAIGVTEEMTGRVSIGRPAWYAVCVISRFPTPQTATA